MTVYADEGESIRCEWFRSGLFRRLPGPFFPACSPISRYSARQFLEQHELALLGVCVALAATCGDSRCSPRVLRGRPVSGCKRRQWLRAGQSVCSSPTARSLFWCTLTWPPAWKARQPSAPHQPSAGRRVFEIRKDTSARRSLAHLIFKPALPGGFIQRVPSEEPGSPCHGISMLRRYSTGRPAGQAKLGKIFGLFGPETLGKRASSGSDSVHKSCFSKRFRISAAAG